MSLTFDISQDELPIFLSEVDEHLQTLDEILIHLERLENDSQALQAAFRSAHTLKGLAGVIGHHRMVGLTHSLEAAFDGVRKKQIDVTTPLIDLCLDAVDGLRMLREEVQTETECDLDTTILIDRFGAVTGKTNGAKQTAPAALQNPPQAAAATIPTPADPPQVVQQDQIIYAVEAVIAQNSVASAARAFQLMLAMQELGEILTMQPTQAVIETASPVTTFSARFTSSQSLAEAQHTLGDIPEIESLSVSLAQPSAAIPAAQISEEETPTLSASEHAVATSTPAVTEIEKQRAEESPYAALEKKNGKNRVDMIVRTSVERLDILMSLIGELITDRNHLAQVRTRLEAQHHGDNQVEALSDTVAHLSRITDQLQEEIMRIRMLPISNVFHKFPRIVRDLAQKTGKQIDLIMHGEDTELDRSVIEEINDPLIHLIRNAVDHGIEPPQERIAAGKPEIGKITLSAWHEQGRIVVSVQDDGRGINVDKIKRSALAKGLITEEDFRALSDEKALDLIFLSGFTTASSVTEVSGRGVGMDIVRNNIQRVNGNISVETKSGQGSQFQIILPLTLAIVPSLLVSIGSIVFAIPIVMVAETMRLTAANIKTVRGKPVTVLREKVLPLVHIADVFDLKKSEQHSQYTYVVVVNHGKNRVGLMVDALKGEEEVVVKSLGGLIGDVQGVSSAAILGDGTVALIVDITGLMQLAMFADR